ncbi:unnamed protein product [Cylindrotheca closterium]|uniref:BZIP domain-containing protein n=1 Tax=Cylindrotheca closterium TaxID=2856 RepID=A0AAD2FNX7_9STRA|nr:unnamed protein product [Cylindrotheca closterium]
MEEITKDQHSMDALRSLLQFRSRGYSEESSAASQAGKRVEEAQVDSPEGQKRSLVHKDDESPSSSNKHRRLAAVNEHVATASNAASASASAAAAGNENKPGSMNILGNFQSVNQDCQQQLQQQIQKRREAILSRVASSSNLTAAAAVSPHHHNHHHHHAQQNNNNGGLYFPSTVSSSMAAMQESMNMHHQHHQNNAYAQINLAAAQAAMIAAANAVAAVSRGEVHHQHHQQQQRYHHDDSHQHMLSPATLQQVQQQQQQQQQQPVTPPSSNCTAAYSSNAAAVVTAGRTSGNTIPATKSSTSIASLESSSSLHNNDTVSSTNSTSTSTTATTTTTTTTAKQLNIRREKVEAALRSKPQRGKKRDDLSAKERLELTRTRNREHAKTTRIRKKARYQELLDCETKLQILLQQQEIEELQQKAVETFISLRQNMIRCSCSCEQDTQDEDDEEEEALGYDYSKSSSSSFQEAPPKVLTMSVDHASILAKLVQNENQFDLQVSKIGASSTGASSSPSSSSSSLMLAMNQFMAMDHDIVDRAVERYGVGAQKYFLYQLKSGISLTKKPTSPGAGGITAMAEIELYMELTPCNRTHLQTCLLKVQFDESQQVLLQSVAWTVLKDSLADDETTVLLASTKREASSLSSSAQNKTGTASISRTVSSSKQAHYENDNDDDDANDNDANDTNSNKNNNNNNGLRRSNLLQSQPVFPSMVSLEQSKAMGQQGGSSSSLGMPL